MLYKLVSVDVVYEACHLFVPLHIILCLFYGTFRQENVLKLGQIQKLRTLILPLVHTHSKSI